MRNASALELDEPLVALEILQDEVDVGFDLGDVGLDLFEPIGARDADTMVAVADEIDLADLEQIDGRIAFQ